MSAIVDHLDSVITRLADLADNPNFDYLQLVVLLGWLQTSFEVLLWYVGQLLHHLLPATLSPLSLLLSPPVLPPSSPLRHRETLLTLQPEAARVL
jgi:hypothetical protein